MSIEYQILLFKPMGELNLTFKLYLDWFLHFDYLSIYLY